MFNWRCVLCYGIFINSMWLIVGNLPTTNIDEDHSLAQLSVAEEQYGQITASDVQTNILDDNGAVIPADVSPPMDEAISFRTNSNSSVLPFSQNSPNLPLFDARVDISSCAEATACSQRSGYYYITIPTWRPVTLVECDAHTDGGDWLVIQRRHDGSVDFYRSWGDYKNGFGDTDGEFFIGLDKLHALTNYNGPQELLILMETINSTSFYAKYDTFVVGSEFETYTLQKLGKYSGNAGDSLRKHLGYPFSTKGHGTDWCATTFKGAWWYFNCYESNLNGLYGVDDATGIRWESLSTPTLKTVKMMIRRRRY